MTTAPGWRVEREGDGFRLTQGGAARLLLGGQVHNSSSSSRPAIEASFAHAKRMGANTVLAPVSWAQLEPAEGTFAFDLVDAMLEAARVHDLRLVPLWFGAFKNAGSTYAPRWVRANRGRFPRARIEAKSLQAFTYVGATDKPVLSVFGQETLEADARAFAALTAHLAEADEHHAVAMIQVENEVGLLSDSRDRSAAAEDAWNAPVPDALVELLRAGAAGDVAARLWSGQGAPEGGSWAQMLGDSWEAEEIFMAWGFASYIERVAQGRVAASPPLYANVWLGPQPGQEEAGQYPSGGPGTRVLEIWRAFAPSLALIGPDIYVDDVHGVMRAYADGRQPLFVPECRYTAPEVARALALGAIGWSAFGIDGGNPDGQVAAMLAWVATGEHVIARAQSDGAIRAVVLEPGEEEVEVDMSGTRIVARDTRLLFQRMLLDAGVRAPSPEVELPDETAGDVAIPHAADPRPFGLILLNGDNDDVVVIGRGITVDFFEAGRRVEIDEVVELCVADGRWAEGRVLNGDERLRVVPLDRVGGVRVRLLRL